MTELDAFLQAAKARGAQDDFLVALLKEHGWPSSTVYQALGRYYTESTGVGIPEAKGRMESAREAFFHLLAFTTLATWVCATGSLWFELINYWFPDATASYYRYSSWRWSRVSWEMSSLIVAFPAFVYATRAILRELGQNPDKAASPVRRWLTNLALLITALVFIGDLVTFVAAFLQGELTVRFVLRCLVVFILAGAVFLYYSRGLGKSSIPPRTWHRGFAVAAAGIILLSLSLGFLKTGSPEAQRASAEDARRVRDLHQIASRIHDHWQRQQPESSRKLPASLAALTIGAEAGLVTKDPFNGSTYEFDHDTSSGKYELCAIFTADTPEIPGEAKPAWWHTAGRYCFELDAAKYPPNAY